MDKLTDREISLIEELGVAKRIIDIHSLVTAALVVRLGGEVKITHAEMEHTRQQYHMVENIQVENYQADITMRVRLN
jgi:hypothetical protein